MTNRRDGLLKSGKIADVIRCSGSQSLMPVKAASEGFDI